MEHTSSQRRRIGLIGFPGVTALDFIGPMEAFAAAFVSDEAGQKRSSYELIVIGLNHEPFTAGSGVVFQPHTTLDAAPPVDTILIPGGSGLRTPEINRQVVQWLQHRSADIRRIATVCTGIYGLAPTGLLDGRRVTTHWAFSEDVARRFPKLAVDATALFIKDGKFYTSAGVTAGIDLTLALIEEDCGPSVALSVARELVVYVRRLGGQEQYSEPLKFQEQAIDRFADLVAWIPAHLNQTLSVEKLAERVGMSPRHFSRQFTATLGVTPAMFVEGQRMEEARRRLTVSRVPIEIIASSLGYHSADVFSRVFERRFGFSPRYYRDRFSAAAPNGG